MGNFDNSFKKVIKSYMEEASDMQVVIADGLAYKIDKLLEKNITLGHNALFGLLRNGGGSKSNVPNVDLTTVTYYLTFACYQEKLDDILSAIVSVSNEKNATPLTLPVNSLPVKFRAVFGVPQIERSLDLRVGESIDKVILITQTLQVTYGENAWIKGKSYSLKIGNTTYPINGIIRVENAYSPAYDTYQKKGSARQSEELQSNISGFVFTLVLLDSDALQIKLNDYLYAHTEYADEQLKLIVDFNYATPTIYEVPITTFSFTSTVENNVGSATLTLKY